MRWGMWIAVLTLWVMPVPCRSASADSDPAAADEQILKAAGIGADSPALLEFFRQRTLTDADRRQIEQLIRQLNDDSFEVRENASADLVDWGLLAVPLLRGALQNPALEVVRRAERCLKKIPPEPDDTLGAAARLLAVRRPPGAAEVLLAFLPSASDDQARAEVQATLGAVAFPRGVADPALLRALGDRVPLRRQAAAEALCRVGGRRVAPLVRRLLHDPDADVRLRVALLLADFRDADVIPVLLAALAGPKSELAAQADEYLRRLAGQQAPTIPLGNTEASRRTCHDAWTAWWRAVDGRALLEWIRKGTPNEKDREKAEAWIALLSDDDFAVRQQASEELVSLGAVAAPLLQQATKDPDIEVVRRAEECLREIDKGPNPSVPANTAWLVALRKPPGAVAVLLAYVPFAEEGNAVDEVQDALTALALHDGKPEAALMRALHDPLPLRRGVAAVALCESAADKQVPVVKSLLRDADPGVRLRVAMALAKQKYKEAIPVLIGLLADLPPDQLWPAEELLRRLAGEQAPAVALGTSTASRQECRAAWDAWWRRQGTKIDMAVLDSPPRLLGYTLVSLWNNRGAGGMVLEIGPDKKTRWHIDGLQFPIDAEVLPGNRVLIAEWQGGRVTERNFKGDILWQHPANNPINVQRLPNGNTFIACYSQLLEVDRTGKQVFLLQEWQGVAAARKLRNGQIAMISQNGTFSRMDAAGKVLKSFPVGQSNLGGFDALPNGRIVVPEYGQGKVVEYDPDGKTIWQANIAMPTSASRLPNGHTLVVCQNAQRVVELDRAGKQVWEYHTDGRPWHARRR